MECSEKNARLADKLKVTDESCQAVEEKCAIKWEDVHLDLHPYKLSFCLVRKSKNVQVFFYARRDAEN